MEDSVREMAKILQNPSDRPTEREGAYSPPPRSSTSNIPSSISVNPPSFTGFRDTSTIPKSPWYKGPEASTTGPCVGTDRNINRHAEKPAAEKPAPSGLRSQLEENSLVIPESDVEEDVLPEMPPLPQPKKSRHSFLRRFE